MTLDLTPAEETISVLIADDDALPFAVTDGEGAPAPVTGATFRFLVLPSQYSQAADALITKTEADMTISAGAGTGTIPITPADKASLLVGSYYYRLEMRESNGTDTTLMRGSYRVVG